MLTEVGWTRLPAEKQHASLEMLHKWHTEYDSNTLVCRALMLQMNKLLPVVSKQEREAATLSDKLQRILRASPDKVRGRQLLFGAMVAICQRKKDEGRPGYEASMFKIAQHCGTRHTAMWAQQTLAQQDEWHQRARQHALSRRHLLEIQWQVVGAELAKLEEDISEVKQQTHPLTMRSAALDEADLDIFARLWQQPAFRSTQTLALKRADVGIAPRFVVRMDDGPEVWQRAEPTMPAWATPLVFHRGTFNGSAVVVLRQNGDREFWKIVFAIQHPKYYLGMCRLHPIEPPSPFDLAAPPISHDPEFAFNINYADCASAAQVTIGATDDMKILLRLRHEGGTRVTSDMVPLSVEYIMSGDGFDLGPLVGGEQKQPAQRDPAYEQLVEALPWLQHLDFTSMMSTGDDGASASGSTGRPGHIPEIHDDEIWAGLAQLERARISEGFAAAAAGVSRDFTPSVRGGTSELLRSGIAVHAAQGHCTNLEATAWARGFAHTTFKATHSEHGPAESSALVRSWCHRMQFFF